MDEGKLLVRDAWIGTVMPWAAVEFYERAVLVATDPD